MRRRSIRRLLHIPDRRVESEVDDELAFHIAMRAAKLREAGMTDEAARQLARERFGNVTDVRDECVRVDRQRRMKRRWSALVADLSRDLSFAMRAAARARGFTIAALFTIATGIGATTAVFSMVSGILVDPLPYPEPNRLVRVFGASGQNGSWHAPLSGPNFDDFRTGARSLSAIGGTVWNEATVTGLGEPIRAMTTAIVGDFFGAMGERPLIGRTILPSEAVLNGPRVAVVSRGFWERHLGGTQQLDGKRITLRGNTYDVVGVMPASFSYPNNSEIWIATFYTDAAQRSGYLWSAIARLAPGATIESARAELNTIGGNIRASFGEDAGLQGARVQVLIDTLVGDLRTPLYFLLGAVGFVLLIACVNLASATLARAEARRIELSIRAALGAGRARLVRQLLAESIGLATVGGVLGCALAVALIRVLASLGPAATGLRRLDSVALDARMLVCAATLSVVSGALVGLLPAWRASRRDLRDGLAGGAKGSTADGARTRRTLVVAEVALALALVAGGGLLVRSLQMLMSGHPGFDADGVVTLAISIPENKYADSTTVVPLFDRFLAGAASTPSVQGVGFVNSVPFGGSEIGGGLMLDSDTERGKRGAYYRLVSPGYFGAMRIPVVRGRGFDARDRAGATPVAVVSEAFARVNWPGENPIGRRLKWVPKFDEHDDWLEVVGVVGNTKSFARDDGSGPAVYVNYAQRPERALEGVTAVVRVTGAPGPVITALRSQMRALDRDIPASFSTLDATIARSVAARRFIVYVMLAFGAFALFLAALGLFSVLSYETTRRTREIGVRVALGATTSNIAGLVLREGMVSVGLGTLIGIAGALALTRSMRGMLYGVGPTDPLAFGAAVVVLGGVGLVASFLPARRASRVDPVTALRGE